MNLCCDSYNLKHLKTCFFSLDIADKKSKEMVSHFGSVVVKAYNISL